MDRLVDLAGQNEPPDLRCPWCKRFLEMSKQLVERDVYVVYRALEEKEKTNLPAIDEKTVKLPLPAANGRVYLCLEPEETACAHLEGERAVVRIYSKSFCRSCRVASGWIWGIMYTVSMPRRRICQRWRSWRLVPGASSALPSAGWMWTTWARRFTLVSSRRGKRTR